MIWFDGSIEDAIDEAHIKNSFFVVYVEGFDRSSEVMTEVLNSQDIAAILKSDKYVNVRVKFDSEEYHHFVSMYKHVPVPSFFVIGLNGVPYAIVKNLYGEDREALHKQIKNALLIEGKGLAGDLVQKCAKDSAQPELVCKETVQLCSLNRNKNVNNMDEISVHENFDFLNSPTYIIADSSLEKKTESEVEKQKKKENIAASRSYSKSKRQIDNSEDTRKQELQQERIRLERDRQRILNDIEIDKQERMLRQQIEKQPISNNLNEANPNTVIASLAENETQIQFRKPDSSTHTKIFDKRSTINELHSYVIENLHINSRCFKLGTAFPRHIFTDDEKAKSLEELNLTPSAVIIIILIKERNSVLTYMYSHVHFAFTFVTQPVVTIYCYIRDSLFQRTQPQIQQGVLRPQQEARDNPSASSRIAARNRKLSHQGSSMGQRNVHTMAHVNNDKKEDRNDVWNGNSTQQTQ